MGVERADAEAARWDAEMAAEDDEPPAIAIVGRPNVGKCAAQRAAGRGAGDRDRHPGHDPRRDRHDV